MTAPAPPAGAQTAEAFDTTSASQRAAALAAGKGVKDGADSGGGQLLGTTIASLGDPRKPGFWLETPLVETPQTGRVYDPSTNTAVAVELLPIPVEKQAGSRLSLAAMRLLGVPLTGLPRLEVYKF